MFEINSITHNNLSKSKVISKTINLENNLTLFISGGSKDHNFIDFLLNKILDHSINKISSNNTYKDFSSVLEKINTVLKTWNSNLNETAEMHMFIGVLNGNSFLFSNIGKSSCYLIKKNNVIEITDKKEKKKEFSYISNGELENKDIISFSNKRLFNLFSESDLIDSYEKNIINFNNALQEILEEENYKRNISIISFIYKTEKLNPPTPKINFIKNIGLRVADTNLFKRILAYFLILKENFQKKGIPIKKIIFGLTIIILITLLYYLISSNLNKNNKIEQNTETEKIYNNAEKAYINAQNNISNKDLFELDIKLCQKNIKILQEKKIYLENVKELQRKISLLKKSANGIETFIESGENRLLKLESKENVKILGLNGYIYIIGKKAVLGPVIKGIKLKIYKFENIGNDSFKDATTIGNQISLITEKGKIVIFKKNGSFNFIDVKGQNKWEKSDTINSYGNQRIYLISKEEGQIYKHVKSGSFFGKASPYIKSKDQKDLKGILDIAIDGGFYILKKDLSFVKFFSGKNYKLVSLHVNKAPKNYKIENKDSPIKIKVRDKLNYLYMLLNNRIYIFKPTPKGTFSTKSLDFIGQIEGTSNKIIDFHIPNDKEIVILNKTGVYKIRFEVEDGKLTVR